MIFDASDKSKRKILGVLAAFPDSTGVGGVLAALPQQRLPELMVGQGDEGRLLTESTKGTAAERLKRRQKEKPHYAKALAKMRLLNALHHARMASRDGGLRGLFHSEYEIRQFFASPVSVQISRWPEMAVLHADFGGDSFDCSFALAHAGASVSNSVQTGPEG